MKDLIQAFEKEDFGLIKAKAHSIKGSSGYIGAGIIYYCCFQI
jgi:HPt (histidine-containing phosphotransfer) domain-containing protein